MYIAIYEYSTDDSGGAGLVGAGLYADARDAMAAARTDFVQECDDVGDYYDAYRVDVWDVGDDYPDADAAFTAWRDMDLQAPGDALAICATAEAME